MLYFRGIRTKYMTYFIILLILNYDILILTKTWLSSAIVNAELGFTRFTIFRADRNVCSSTWWWDLDIGNIDIMSLFIMLCCTWQSVEQHFINLCMSKKHILLKWGVLSASIEVYMSHAEKVDELWQSY